MNTNTVIRIKDPNTGETVGQDQRDFIAPPQVGDFVTLKGKTYAVKARRWTEAGRGVFVLAIDVE